VRSRRLYGHLLLHHIERLCDYFENVWAGFSLANQFSTLLDGVCSIPGLK